MSGDRGKYFVVGDKELLSDFDTNEVEFCFFRDFDLLSSSDYYAIYSLFLIIISFLSLIGVLSSFRIFLVFSFRTAASSFCSVFMVMLESSVRHMQLDFGEALLDLFFSI